MKIYVTFISSPNMNNDPLLKEKSRAYLDRLEKIIDCEISFADIEKQRRQGCIFFYVASGGSESSFMDALGKLSGYCCFITTDNNSSLAASLEMLAYLREHGKSGEIIHGGDEFTAKKILSVAGTASAVARFRSKPLAVIGRANERIASFIDEKEFERIQGHPLSWLLMEELIDEIRAGGYPANQWTEKLLSEGYDSREMEKSLSIYGALRRLVDRHGVGAVSVRCFDLLRPTASTGCLALAILNAEGVPAACEGDVKALVTMAAANAVTGCPGFMANPSRLDPERRELVIAHCTLPVSMPESYTLTTHYESGTGIALAGQIPLGSCTVLKTDGVFLNNFVCRGEIVENLHECNLCRTQIRIKMDCDMEYFLKRPIANHHVVCCGDCKEDFERFFAMIREQREN